jgi:hypothetical protein
MGVVRAVARQGGDKKIWPMLHFYLQKLIKIFIFVVSKKVRQSNNKLTDNTLEK